MGELSKDQSRLDAAEAQGQEGLLFTGEAIRALTPEQVAAIGDVANRLFGVEMRSMQSVEHELGEENEQEPEPLPITYTDFREYAKGTEYTDATARRAWMLVRLNGAVEGLPPIKLFETEVDKDLSIPTAFDLRDVYRRLTAPGGVDPKNWPNARKGKPALRQQLDFLARAVNDLLHPEQPVIIPDEFEP